MARIDPKSGYHAYVVDLGRVGGEGYPKEEPALGAWGPQTWGTVITHPVTGEVIPQFPGLPRWWP